MKTLAYLLSLLIPILSALATDQPTYSVNFTVAPLEQVNAFLTQLTGEEIANPDNLQVALTLRTPGGVSKVEAIRLIRHALGMQGVAIHENMDGTKRYRHAGIHVSSSPNQPANLALPTIAATAGIHLQWSCQGPTNVIDTTFLENTPGVEAFELLAARIESHGYTVTRVGDLEYKIDKK